jgi:Replication-relaxation
MTRAYLTSARLQGVVDGLSERDLALLVSLRRLRLASAAQLERLHFTDATPRWRRQVLAALVARRLVVRLPRTVGGVRAGSAGHVYALGPAGLRLTDDGTGPRRPSGTWLPGLAFVRHRLAITELYVQLVEAERAGLVDLVTFQAEPASWRRFADPGGATVTLKPDAYVAVGAGDGSAADHWYVEVDLGSESATALARKCDAYRAAWAAGVDQQRLGAFPRVLFTVPDQARHTTVVDVLGRQPAEAWALFGVSRFDHAVEHLAEEARR